MVARRAEPVRPREIAPNPNLRTLLAALRRWPTSIPKPNASAMTDNTPDLEGEVLEAHDVETQEPPMYRVLLHNDGYTTMEFVIQER